MFKFIHISGRALSKAEEDLLDRIDQHSVTGFPLLRDLHNQVSVEIHDKKDEYKTVEVDIDALIKEAESLQDRRDWIHRHCYSEERGNELEEIGDFLHSVENTIETAEKSYDATVDITIEKLGEFEYSSQHPLGTIRLFIDNIGYDSHRLASTYVHEMMHAYFATRASNEVVTEIEEAIVECCTLRFLYSFYGKTRDFSRILTEVKKKKYSLGLGYYGFGAYLYACPVKIDWRERYKGANSKIPATDYDVLTYANAFRKGYPYDNENQIAQLLLDILSKAKGRRSSDNLWDAYPCVDGVILNSPWKKAKVTPKWAYEKENQTLCLDGFWSGVHLRILLNNILRKVQSSTPMSRIYLAEYFMCDDNFQAIDEFWHNICYLSGSNSEFLIDKKNIIVDPSYPNDTIIVFNHRIRITNK